MELSISDVERETSIPKETLRIWERRYGFPRPARDESGDRRYNRADVEKLAIVKRLLDLGHRPSKIVGRPMEELNALAEPSRVCLPASEVLSHLLPYLERLRGHHLGELRMQLLQSAMRHGLHRFIIDTAAPLCEAVGAAWARDEMAIYEEHLFTETMHSVLRTLIEGMPTIPEQRPRILMTTFPAEEHQLGLLMAQALMALEGAHCISLGTQTPVDDIVIAAHSQAADIVALSFSGAYPELPLLGGLSKLRSQLPAQTGVWIGGGNKAAGRAGINGVTMIPRLDQIHAELLAWRAQRSVAAERHSVDSKP